MFTIIICLMTLFLIYVGAENGETGVILVAVVVGGLLLMVIAGIKKDSRAMLNFRDYWADGGPDRDK